MLLEQIISADHKSAAHAALARAKALEASRKLDTKSLLNRTPKEKFKSNNSW